MIEDELIAEIVAAPDDTAAYLVYADWLQQRGDPRGRLIAVQIARAAADDPALEAEEVALTAAHPELRGPPIDPEHRPAVKWTNGFWSSLMLGGSWPRRALAADELGAMLASPSARFLRMLWVRNDATVEVVPHIAARAATLALLTLDLGPGKIDDDVLLGLAACTRIWSLTLSSCERLTARGLAALRAMPGLGSIELHNYTLDDAGAAQLAGLPLYHVQFNAVGALTPDGMRVLAAAPLEWLQLDGDRLGDAHIATLAGHDTLTDLDLSRGELGERGAEALAGIATLSNLVLHGATTTAAALRRLARAPGLRVLDLGQAQGVDDDAASALARLPALAALDVAGTSITGRGLAALRGRSLRGLDLSDLALTDRDVRGVAELPELEQLALGGNDLGDGVIDVLLQLPNLELVDLARSRVTADGIARLAAHPTLTVVGLDGCPDDVCERATEVEGWSVERDHTVDLDFSRYS